MRRTKLPSDETALVQLAASCNNDAFCAVIKRFNTHIRYIVSKYAPNREDREDLQAEITAKLLHNSKRALRAWRPVAPFAAYLTTVSTRHCLQWCRREKLTNQLSLPALPGRETYEKDLLDELVPTEKSVDPAYAVQNAERLRAVLAAMEQLSSDDRLILALKYQEGMNGPAIARALHISHGAARKRIFTALRRLQKSLTSVSSELSIEQAHRRQR